jgi:hypothetical protein
MNNVAKFVLENPDAVKDMAKDIRRWIKKSCTEAVNETAFEARKNLVNRVKNEFYIRNDFLTSPKSLFVTKAPFGNVDNIKDIQASVGFSEEASFMVRQDEGGYHEAEKGKRLRIYTDRAREGETKAGRVKRLAHYTKNKQKTAVIPYFKKGTSHKSLQVRRAAIAYKSGLLMYFGKSLYQVTSFEKGGGNVHFEKHMIINREYERTKTPAKNFFMPECHEAAKDIQKRFIDAMERNKDGH